MARRKKRRARRRRAAPARRRRSRGSSRPQFRNVLITSAALGFVRGQKADLFAKVPAVGGLTRTQVLALGSYFFRKKNKWLHALAYSAGTLAVNELAAKGFKLEGGGLMGDDDDEGILEGEIDVPDDILDDDE